MPTPLPPDHERRRNKEIAEQLFREGYAPPNVSGGKGSAYQEASRRAGVSDSTFQSWGRMETREKRKGNKHFLPDFNLYKPPKAKVRIPAGSEKQLPEGYIADPEQKPTVRVRYVADHHDDLYIVAIGDAHDAPGMDKSRFRWAGQFVAHEKPDAVIQIGDLMTMNSINSYDLPGTKEFKDLPTFPDDINSGEEALTAFDEGADGYECEKHICAGNHEDRIFSFQNRNPQIANMLQLEVDRLLGRHMWTYSLFAQPTFFGGVAFSHVPLSIMSRPIGGELATQNIAQKSIHDWVYGHSHRADTARRPKLGGYHITAINLGCYLPVVNGVGHIERYVKHGSMTGWWYGLWTLKISKGRIQSYRQHTVSELEERFG